MNQKRYYQIKWSGLCADFQNSFDSDFNEHVQGPNQVEAVCQWMQTFGHNFNIIIF